MEPSEVLRCKNKLIEQISKSFDKEKIEQIAFDTKFVQRESKFTGVDFFFLCVFAHQIDSTMSLEGLCAELLKEEGKYLCKQSLQDRYNDEGVSFMKQMVHEALKDKIDLPPIVPHPDFGRIILGDSTVFELPEKFSDKYAGSGGGASKAAVKIQYNYDLLRQDIQSITLQKGTCSDVKQELGIVQKNDLRIEDMGYFKLQRFEDIVKAEAYFLSRLKFGTLVYEHNELGYQEIDLLKIQKKMKAGERKIMKVYLGKKEKLPVRLILEKVPVKVADEKRRKLKTDKQNKRKNLSKRRLEFCNLNVYITNTTEEQLPSEQVRNYYSLRWQIELVFKAWKSVYNIDKIKPMKIQRFECNLYGTLLLIILTTNLLAFYKRNLYQSTKKELSEIKMFKTLKHLLPTLKKAVTKSKKSIIKFMNLLEDIVLKTCIKQQKRNALNPFNIISIAP